MKASHLYELNGWQAARAVLPPPLVAATLALLLEVACWLGWMPPPRARLDPDRTVLAYKRQVSRARHPARTLLTGDSACMTGVDPVRLSADLPGREAALNLGLIIGLDFETYGEAVADFIQANPSQVQCVVLLVTPEKLRSEEGSAEFLQVWRRLGSELRDGGAGGWAGRGIGLEELRERLLGRWLARPLRGTGADQYGFPGGIWDYLEAHDGAVLDWGSYQPGSRPQPPDYVLAPSREAGTRRLRSLIPRPVRLVAGLMPVPESLRAAGAVQKRDALLDNWNRWLEADHLLKQLPAVLPDGLFASGAHLNPEGQRRFTRLLATELGRLPPGPGRASRGDN
jgi:hypothetical protein